MMLWRVYVEYISVRFHLLYLFGKWGSGRKQAFLTTNQGKAGKSQGILIRALGMSPVDLKNPEPNFLNSLSS